jgi:hypothetical protein
VAAVPQDMRRPLQRLFLAISTHQDLALLVLSVPGSLDQQWKPQFIQNKIQKALI